MQIFDTAGQERFRSIVSSYYRSSNCVIIVFDLTNQDTFKSISYWMSLVNDLAGDKTLKFLVGNKADLSDQRKVSEESCLKLAKQYDCKYFETSAYQNTNIDELFDFVAKEAIESDNYFHDDSIKIKTTTKDDNPLDSCC